MCVCVCVYVCLCVCVCMYKTITLLVAGEVSHMLV